MGGFRFPQSGLFQTGLGSEFRETRTYGFSAIAQDVPFCHAEVRGSS
jgi:hypothetical protein